MNIKKNDNVIIRSGKDRGKQGKVVSSLPKDAKIVVEGVNLKKRHQRPRKSGEKGQILSKPAPIAVSSVSLMCPKCGKGVRVRFGQAGGKKIRLCARCGSEI